ncbi:hypothetical protein D3C75_905600 [compost metagenome]
MIPVRRNIDPLDSAAKQITARLVEGEKLLVGHPPTDIAFAQAMYGWHCHGRQNGCKARFFEQMLQGFELQRFTRVPQKTQAEQSHHLHHAQAQVRVQAATDDSVLYQCHLRGTLDEFQAIHTFHAQVAHHDIDRADLLQQSQCFGGISRFEHLLATQPAQHLDGNGALESMVFHYQYT